MYMLQIQTLCLSELFYGNVYMCAGKVGEFGEMLWNLHLKPKLRHRSLVPFTRFLVTKKKRAFRPAFSFICYARFLALSNPVKTSERYHTGINRW